MNENTRTFLVFAIILLFYVREHVIRPYYYYKYSDQYYESGRWLRPDEAIKKVKLSGEKIKGIKYSFMKTLPMDGRDVQLHWFSYPPVYFIDLYENPGDEVDMKRLKAFYLRMCYISLFISTAILARLAIMLVTGNIYEYLLIGLIGLLLFSNWVMIKYTYRKKEKYIKRSFEVNEMSSYYIKTVVYLERYMLLIVMMLILAALLWVI